MIREIGNLGLTALGTAEEPDDATAIDGLRMSDSDDPQFASDVQNSTEQSTETASYWEKERAKLAQKFGR